MHANAADYPNGQASQEVKLGALGFNNAGHRGGGIQNPKVQTLPVGAVLLRLHTPVGASGGIPGDFGAWWFTPHEYRRICGYFGVDGRALTKGRASGKSALHGVLALLHEWYGGQSTQLSYLNAVRVKEPLYACYGSGAPANADGYARTLKPTNLGGGTARQIYIHKCWLYQKCFDRLAGATTKTENVLGAMTHTPPWLSGASRLPFEP